MGDLRTQSISVSAEVGFGWDPCACCCRSVSGGWPPGGGRVATLLTPPVLLWAYFTAAHAATVIQDRYHFAFIPFVSMLTVAGALGVTAETHWVVNQEANQ